MRGRNRSAILGPRPVERLPPTLNELPLLGHLLQGQVNQFEGGVLARKRSPRLDDLAQGHVQRRGREFGEFGRLDLD